MVAPALRFSGVSFAYPGGRLALDGVSFSVGVGQRVSVVGPNGGGKSTLVKLALGLLRPDRGLVEVCGHAPHVACRRVGYLPQGMALPLMPATAMDVVRMGLIGHRECPKSAVAEALERVQAGELARRPFAELSGGQRQRVLLARALVGRPSLLFLDEPVAHLDPEAAGRFRLLMRNLPPELTVVTVTHDLTYLEAEADFALCVNRTVHEHPTRRIGPSHLGIDGVGAVAVLHEQCLSHGEDCQVGTAGENSGADRGPAER